jgi:hypothetical protein
LAEALVAGASDLLELETSEITAFPLRHLPGKAGEQIVFYETVPGGAGYLEEMARRLPDVANAAMERLFGHRCLRACYLCLKHFRNQRWHNLLDKHAVADLLLVLSKLDPVEPEDETFGRGAGALESMLEDRKLEAAADAEHDSRGRYRKGFIEEPLARALASVPELPPPDREFEIRDQDRVITVPDFTWPDARLAVYCDGFAFHGNPETLSLDAAKRNFLQARGWAVLTYWGRTILKDAAACATQIDGVYRQRLRSAGVKSGPL